MTTAMIISVAAGIALVACGSRAKDSAGPASARLTNDERHRLYSAALAVSESPLDTDLFKDVCKEIGIFDANGKPNEKYMAFMTEHVDWGMKSETDQFRQEIDTKEKAMEYISRHRPR